MVIRVKQGFRVDEKRQIFAGAELIVHEKRGKLWVAESPWRKERPDELIIVPRGTKIEIVDSRSYFIYDGRWEVDPDRAMIYCSASTYEEAKRDREMYGDAVVVSYETFDHGVILKEKDFRLEIMSDGTEIREASNS